jgi:hypothetical protein
LVLGTAGIIMLTGNDTDGGGNADPGTSLATTATQSRSASRGPARGSASPAASKGKETITIDCQGLTGQKASAVQLQLSAQGMRTKIERVPGGTADEVVDISPCEARRGDSITITVSTGKGGNQNGGSNAQPSCAGLPLDPFGSCPSSNPSSSKQP